MVLPVTFAGLISLHQALGGVVAVVESSHIIHRTRKKKVMTRMDCLVNKNKQLLFTTEKMPWLHIKMPGTEHLYNSM